MVLLVWSRCLILRTYGMGGGEACKIGRSELLFSLLLSLGCLYSKFLGLLDMYVVRDGLIDDICIVYALCLVCLASGFFRGVVSILPSNQHASVLVYFP